MRDMMEVELARSREIITVGSALVPGFRISAPDSETQIFV